MPALLFVSVLPQRDENMCVVPLLSVARNNQVPVAKPDVLLSFGIASFSV